MNRFNRDRFDMARMIFVLLPSLALCLAAVEFMFVALGYSWPWWWDWILGCITGGLLVGSAIAGVVAAIELMKPS